VVDYLVTVEGRTYRVPVDGEIHDYLQWLIEDRGTPEPFVAMSRQQVVARIGRSALPTDIPDADVVIGDPSREGGFTRGWLESTVAAWEQARTATGVEDDSQQAAPSAPDAGAGEHWPAKTRQWTDVPMTADARVAIVTSRGIVTPSGVVLAGPLPDGNAMYAFLAWHWARKPKDLPQVWLTYEALVSIGVPMDELPRDLADLIATVFNCEVTWHQSGWFTCRFADHDGQKRSAHLVLIPLLFLDPPAQRVGDMGVAGWRNTATDLPDDESEAVKLLSDRIAWLAGVGDGALVPASRWATVGAQLLDRKRSAGRTKSIESCPLPTQVAVEAGELEPSLPLRWSNKPHKARGESIDVEVDQRAAYLASAGQVELGFGKPKELQRVRVDVFNDQRPPFGLWRLTTPPAEQLDGLTRKLPLPHPGMAWTQPATFWITTRGIQHLIAPVELGGAGLGIAELDIDAAWVWPEQSRLLRSWADALRVKLTEAREAGRLDYEQMIKGIYTTYLGRMASDKWQPSQRHHQQPAWYAAVRADTRFRAMRYAAGIVAAHDLYPIAVELDAWIYRLHPGTDPAILEEESTANGKYRVKWTSADADDAEPDGEEAQ
jgi:hypothetical protein